MGCGQETGVALVFVMEVAVALPPAREHRRRAIRERADRDFSFGHVFGAAHEGVLNPFGRVLLGRVVLLGDVDRFGQVDGPALQNRAVEGNA